MNILCIFCVDKTQAHTTKDQSYFKEPLFFAINKQVEQLLLFLVYLYMLWVHGSTSESFPCSHFHKHTCNISLLSNITCKVKTFPKYHFKGQKESLSAPEKMGVKMASPPQIYAYYANILGGMVDPKSVCFGTWIDLTCFEPLSFFHITSQTSSFSLLHKVHKSLSRTMWPKQTWPSSPFFSLCPLLIYYTCKQKQVAIINNVLSRLVFCLLSWMSPL